jgi:peptidoglycan hydrolase-like protein with peptidoglycan-binding domain
VLVTAPGLVARAASTPTSQPTPPSVLALQHRLQELGYWLGIPDGSYGGLTEQAVMAFQKVEGLTPDGVAGVAPVEGLEQAGRARSRSDAGDLVEVDEDRQVILVIQDGRVDWVLNTSTGTEKPYRVGGITEVADTPAGRWRVERVVDGVRQAALSSLYRATDVMSLGSTVWVY